jgi:hypothetical protein
MLVRKRGGADNGRLYAMKTMQKMDIIKDKKTYEHTITERHESAETGTPFLVRLRCAFQTEANLHLVMSEYNKNYTHDWKSTVTQCVGPPWAVHIITQRDI